jgi:hypothetical protein
MSLTQADVRQLFDYDPCSGQLIWKMTRGSRAKKGAVAGSLGGHRYITVRINGTLYYVHRIIWLWHYGQWPEATDHMDCNKLNNKIENLRSANPSQNQCNQLIRADNKSGVKGVRWNKGKRKWQARVQLQWKDYWLGLFDEFEQAVVAVKNARHALHGEFARVE